MQELNELQNLVIQSLESNGALSNIRAQIRASVFKVIDSQDSGSSKKGSPFYWQNPKCQQVAEDPNGLLMLQLIKQFLQFYKMDYSLSVYSSESNIREQIKRDSLNSQLDLPQDADQPLLLTLLQAYQNGGGGPAYDDDDFQSHPKKSDPQVGSSAAPSINKNNALSVGAPAASKQPEIISKPDPQKDSKSSSIDPQSIDPLESSTQEKQNLQEAQDIIQKNQNPGNIKLGAAAPAPTTSQPQPPASLSNQFSTVKGASSFEKSGDYDNENFDEYDENQVNDQLEYDEQDEDKFDESRDPQNQKANQMASSEDILGASQSQGFDMSVDSMALEGYDYFEEVDKP